MYVKSRNPGLDITRSIAILMVLVCHILMWVSTIYSELYGSFKLSFIHLIKLGWLGVEIFFVLSGFLIGKILIKEFIIDFKGSGRAALAKFYTRRWFRTLPMYYLILLLNIVILVTTFSDFNKTIFLQKSAGYFLFLQNFTGMAELGGVSLMEVSWSLVLEEWFYLLFPVFIIFLRKIFKNFNKTTFLKFLISFIVFISLLRIIYVFYNDISFGSIVPAVFLRLDTFAVGILFAYFHTFLPDLYNSLADKKLFISGILFIGLSFYLSIYWAQNFYVKTILLTLLPFSIAVFIAFLEKNVVKRSQKSELTSKISYSLYLIHVPLLANIFAPASYLIMKKNGEIPVFITIIIFFAIIYLTGIFLYRYFEKPMMNLRDSSFIKKLIKDLNLKNKQNFSITYEK